MKFSVIVPVYNAEKYLAECIESVLNQTYKDYELILVNDGSTDGSGKILDDYHIKYPDKVKVFHKENGGQFSARKKGIDLATCNYVISLDADDCLKDDALEILNNYIINTDYPEIIFHKMSIKDDYSVSLVNYNFYDGEIFRDKSKQKLYNLLIGTPKLNAFCGKAYKTSLLKSVVWDGKLIETVSNGEDLLQVLPLFTKAEKIVYCNHTLYYYRQVNTSISHVYNSTIYNSRKLLGRELEQYISLWNMEKTHSISLLNSRLLKDISYIVILSSALNKKLCIEKLSEISCDNWYKKLYENSDKRLLNYKRRVLLYLIYKGYINIAYILLKIKK